jgi:hypothetical protein
MAASPAGQRRLNRVGVTGSLLAACALAIGSIGAGTASAAGPAASQTWSIVHGAKLAPNSALNGLAVVNKRLAWAAGIEGFSSNGSRPGHALMERWNGTAWSRAKLPTTWPGGFASISASSATNAWALGQEPSGTTQHLLHWNGHGWRNSTFPGTPGTFYGNLGITAAPGGRAWLTASSSGNALIYGWNGTAWKQQSYPCTTLVCNVYRIVARTGSDAWAVGNYATSPSNGGPLALHWTGHSWQSTPVPFVKFGYLTGVFAASATNAWAVGQVFNSGTMLLYRWNGTSWRRVAVPAGLTRPALGELPGITGDAFGHLWIFDFGPQTGNRATYLHYDGQHWSKIMGALVTGQTQVIVRDVQTVPGTSVSWSVGLGFVPTLNARARIERYGKF